MFAQFTLHERLLKALNELNFTRPTPVQEAAIPPALEGRDLRVIAQTGSGKTAAFLLPLLHRLLSDGNARPQNTRALIMLPTRELAQQTLSEFERFAQYTFLRATLITGGEGFKEQAADLRKIPDVVIATPGRLVEHLDAGNLPLQEVATLIYDEADRMLDMGFTEDVARISEACSGPHLTWLFSATSGGATMREVVARVLNKPQHLMLNQISELNENTRQQFITADHTHHKEQMVEWLLANETYEKAIIFTNTRAQADRLYGKLVAAHVKVFVLHGEKDQKDRKLAIERLKQGAVKVLVATDVAARGLDVEGLDLVINFDMPHSGDEYVHRIGRTGRAGAEGLAISLVDHTEWNLMSSIERYLRQRFEKRNIKELKGRYQGPKNLKASGKAAGVKKKKVEKKSDKKSSAKPTARRKPGARPKAPSLGISNDGNAPLVRRKAKAE